MGTLLVHFGLIDPTRDQGECASNKWSFQDENQDKAAIIQFPHQEE